MSVLQVHKMIFAMAELPGEFTTFDFVEGIPAPFNFGLAILLNQKMLTLAEKLQCAPALLPMLVEGQDFIDEQDELSVLDFMRKYGMPERINTEVFISMAKALDFIDPDRLSMAVVLTAMNRFLNEDDGLQMGFLDGNQPDRLCAPMADHITKRGGEVRTSAPVKRIVTNDDGSVKHLEMRDGSTVVADEYISAMPVDVMKRMEPAAWQKMPYFRQVIEWSEMQQTGKNRSTGLQWIGRIALDQTLLWRKCPTSASFFPIISLPSRSAGRFVQLAC